MLTLDEIVGQAPAVNLLRSMLSSGRVPHALVFHGPEGIGKATTARAFAGILLCKEQAASACGRCSSCSLVRAGGHPDLLSLGRLAKDEKTPDEKRRLTTAKANPEEADLRAQILIDQVRTLNHFAGLTPREGSRRIFLVDPADRMNADAQNALLKTLEEPPASTVMILVCSRLHLLLGTVRSRSFLVGFSTLGAAELTQVLRDRGVAGNEITVRAALAEGRVGRALELDFDELSARRRDVVEILLALGGGAPDLSQLPGMAAALAGTDEPTLRVGLDLVESLLRDTMRAATESRPALQHSDLEDDLERLAGGLPAARAAELIGTIERLRGHLRYNTNRLLIAESLLAAVAGGPLP